jgi:peroxiredoxin (alkyl hydroperoxide reductase subunit C)
MDYRLKHIVGLGSSLLFLAIVMAQAAAFAESMDITFSPGNLKPIDSETQLKPGDKAPDFTLTSTEGKKITLSDYQGKSNVVLSFVPAAFTPVCSHQWPGYNIAKEDVFDKNNTMVIGISVDNTPSLYAWTKGMGGLWFPVVSDFWPHGEVAGKYGVLRSDGMSERAIFVIDKQGVVRSVDVHNINKLPRIEELAEVLGKLN